MPVTINGDGSIAGLSVGGLGAGVVNNTSLANSTIETAKLTAAAQSSFKTLSFFNQWRLVSDSTAAFNGVLGDSGSGTTWEQVDTYGYSSLGGNMTESSGTFSFPSTGIYLIQGAFRILTTGSDSTVNVILNVTTDNSSYNNVGYTSGGNASGNNTNQTSTQAHIFDVTSTSTHKLRFRSESLASGSYAHGSSTSTQSWFTVIKLAET